MVGLNDEIRTDHAERGLGISKELALNGRNDESLPESNEDGVLSVIAMPNPSVGM